MFDGVPDQFHQFISSSTRTPTATATTLALPHHLSFPPPPHLHHHHHHGTPNSFPNFDSLFTSPSNNLHPQFLHPLQSNSHKIEDKEDDNLSLVAMNMDTERGRSMSQAPPPPPAEEAIHRPWSNDEVIALLRVRSSMENWFPEFTWEHVSRKLAELGFRRSAEKCKEKFEEESRYYNNINSTKNYRIFSELEELCHGDSSQPAAEKNSNVARPSEDEDKMGQNFEKDSRNYQVAAAENASEDNERDVEKAKSRKRKRQHKFEIFKALCEDIVKRLMAQQEEMHNKLLEEMVRRNEEKVAREEAWKQQEMERINKELELRAQEQAIASDRQATIIEFLSKFTSSSYSKKQCSGERNEDLVKVPDKSNPLTSFSLPLPQNSDVSATNNQNKVELLSTSFKSTLGHQNSDSFPTQSNQIEPTSLPESPATQNPSPPLPQKVSTSSSLPLTPQNPNSLNVQDNTSAPTSFSIQKGTQTPTSNDKEGLGKRWPRDEVLALINLRCSLHNNGDHHDKEGQPIKAPLWERISQGMLELGYKRSAKRCKEKWENINKYFRKTKDVNKKRSLDSRTCPYYHQLSALYNQGTLSPSTEAPENRLTLPVNRPNLPENGSNSSQRGATESSMSSVAGGEENVVQAAAFDFEI